MSVLSDNMMNSARSGHTLGATLDQWINDIDHAETIPAACAEFKRDSEQWIVDTILDQSETRAFRKACNNTINEVSRQYRKVHGSSIKCVGRKGGYRYEVAEYTPRTTGTATPPPVTKAKQVTGEVIKECVKDFPYQTMAQFAVEYSLEEIKQFLQSGIDAAGKS